MSDYIIICAEGIHHTNFCLKAWLSLAGRRDLIRKRVLPPFFGLEKIIHRESEAIVYNRVLFMCLGLREPWCREQKSVLSPVSSTWECFLKIETMSRCRKRQFMSKNKVQLRCKKCLLLSDNKFSCEFWNSTQTQIQKTLVPTVYQDKKIQNCRKRITDF